MKIFLQRFSIFTLISLLIIALVGIIVPSPTLALIGEQKPVWARMYSNEKSSPSGYTTMWWSNPAYLPATANVDAYNRTDNSNAIWIVGPGVQEGFWSSHTCARGVPTWIDGAGLTSGSCIQESRDGGTRKWCTWDTPVNGGGDGCELSAFFGNNGNGEANENHTGCETGGTGRYDHFLCNLNGIFNFVNADNNYPDLRYNLRYTYNAYIFGGSSIYTMNFIAPKSFYLSDIRPVYHQRNGGVTYADQTTGYPIYSYASDGYSGNVQFTPESRGTMILARVRKEINGRVVGLNGTNGPPGLSGIGVRLLGRDSTTGSVVVANTTTDSSGNYRFRNNIDNYMYYTIEVTSAAPAGYSGSAYAVKWDDFNAPLGTKIPYTWRSLTWNTVPVRSPDDMLVGDPQYVYQATYWPNDCSSPVLSAGVPQSRCIFGFGRETTPPTTPTIDTSGGNRCVFAAGSQFRWTAASDTSGVAGYNVYIFQGNGCTISGNNVSCSNANYSSSSYPHSPSGGYIYFNSYNFQLLNGGYGTYNIYVQAYDTIGNKGNIASATLNTIGNVTMGSPSLTAIPNGRTGASLNWNPAVGPTNYRVYRNGAQIADVPNTTRSYIDNYCPGVATNYYIQGYNQCDTDNSETRAVTCVPNSQPTCQIEYFNSSTGTYVNYSATQTLNRNAQLSLRAVCSDPNGDPIVAYQWSGTCTGSLNPTNQQYTTFTAPNINSANCLTSVQAWDNYGGSGIRTVIMSTVAASNGFITLSTDVTPFSKTRTISANNSVIVTGYENVANATLSISPTGICAPGVASCVFTGSGLTTISVPSSFGSQSFPIRITVNNNPFLYNYGWTRNITVNFSAGNQTRSNALSMSNVAPGCTSISFNPPSPNSTLNTNVTLNLQDDWSLNSYGVNAINSAGTVVQTVVPFGTLIPQRTVNAANAASNHVFPANFNWNLSGLTEGTYRLVATVRDTNSIDTVCSNNYIPGFDTTFVVDRTAPICELVSFPNVIPAPPQATIVNPMQVNSRARDLVSNLTGVQVFVVPFGGIKPTNAIYNSGVRPLNIAPNVSHTTNPVFSWVTSDKAKGRYDVYVDWYDSAGNITNTNALNRCVQTVELGSQFRSVVQISSDDADKYGFARYEDGSTELRFGVFKNGAWNTSPAAPTAWQVNDINRNNCRAQHPNGVSNDDHDNNPGAGACDDYFLSPQVYAENESANVGILIPKYNGVPKYRCEQILVNGANRPITGSVYPLDANYDICYITGGFNVQKGTRQNDLYNLAAPSLVEFKLSYNVDGVAGKVYDRAGGTPGSYVIRKTNPLTGSAATFASAAGENYFYVPGGTDVGNAWAAVPNARANISITGSDSFGSIPNGDCFYVYNNNPPYPNTPRGYIPGSVYASISSSIRDVANPLNVTRVEDCNINNLALTHNKDSFTPRYQNQLSVIVAPELQIRGINASTGILLADNADNCGPGGNTIPMPYDTTLTLRSGATVLETISSSSGDIAFTSPLDFNSQYSVCVESVDSFLALSNFGFCATGGPNGTNCFTFSPNLNRNVNSDFASANGFLATFPNVNGNPVEIMIPIKMYMKESNNWWQVYNGGVHSNSQIQINSNEIGSSEGMPAGGVIVGDPRNPITSFHNIPVGFDMYTPLNLTQTPMYTGGLVSAFGVEPAGFNDFGIQDGGGNKNWNIRDFVSVGGGGTNKPLQFELSVLASIQGVHDLSAAGQNGWSNASSINQTLTNNKKYYPRSGDVIFSYGSTLQASNLSSSFVVAVVDLSGGSSNIQTTSNTLTINSNIDLGNTSALVLYVNGNVRISPSVTMLNSVFIVSTGNITVASLDPNGDLDSPLMMRGGLYGNDVEFLRNLSDTIDPLNPLMSIRPATSILYDNSITSKSHNMNLFPAEMTESKIYWVVRQ